MKAKELFNKNGELVHKLRTESDLLRYINTREDKAANYSLFLGAGASVNSGIRTANQLIKEWVIELFERFNQKEPNDIDEARDYFKQQHANWYNPANPYSSLFEKKYDLPSQRRRFIEQEVDQKLPSIGYAYLISLVDQNFFNTIFTTNFDDLINEAFYQFSNNRPIYCAHDSSIHSISITSKRPKILKLHGDYLFDDIKSTLKETESLEQNSKEKLIEFCKEFGLIVIGYSGNDRSVMDVLEFLTKQENYLKNGVYWCLRNEDHVSLALRNLLWKDKVYPVIIDGFDQFLAKSYKYLIGSGLDIESNTKQSKLQKTINEIIDDRYDLASNEIIKTEIETIKNSNSKHDISSFITDISKDSDSELPLSDFRNLLEIEDLINKRNYQSAYDLCKAYYNNAHIEISKSKYLKKLITLSYALDDKLLSRQWSDQLIELDRYNLSYNFTKADSIFDLKKKFEFLNNLIDIFSSRYLIYNRIVAVGFQLFKNDPIFSNVSLDDLIQFLDKSLKLNPSLSNYAWIEKLDIIAYQCKFESEPSCKKEEIDKLICDAIAINPEHLSTLNLRAVNIARKNNFKESKELIEAFYEVKKKLSKHGNIEINELIDDLVPSIIKAPNNEGSKDILKDFFEFQLNDIEIKDNCKFLISKTKYYIGQKRDLKTAERYFLQALAAKNSYSYMDDMVNLSYVFKEDYITQIDEILEKEKYRLSRKYYISSKAEINLKQKKYAAAIDNLKESLSIGYSVKSYLIDLSFSYLQLKEYPKIINLRNLYKETLKIGNYDAFFINYQFALKKIGHKDFDEAFLRNLTSQSDEIDVKICAFSLLENCTDARRHIKSQIQKSYLKYFSYKRWPAIKKDYLKEIDEIKVA